jgi:hypothetical protein
MIIWKRFSDQLPELERKILFMDKSHYDETELEESNLINFGNSDGDIQLSDGRTSDYDDEDDSTVGQYLHSLGGFDDIPMNYFWVYVDDIISNSIFYMVKSTPYIPFKIVVSKDDIKFEEDT